MTWWHYLLLANIYLVVFFGFYVLFLRKETFFQLNRIYLVGAALLSFLIPLIQSDWIKNLFITQQVQQTIYNLPVVAYRISAVHQDEHYTMGQLIGIIYLTGIVVLTLKLAWQLFTLKRIIAQPKAAPAYSFFNKINVDEHAEDLDIIIAHEQAHARQWHSADILLVEAIMIINWFNPVVYFYRKAVKHIHEFIADQDALKAGTDKAEYAMLLLSQTFIAPTHSLVTPFFNHSLLKQRIMMLHKNKSQRIKLIKYGLSAPLFALMLILSSATVNNSKTINIIHDKAEEVFLTPATGESTSEISAQSLSDTSDQPAVHLLTLKDTVKSNNQVFTAVEKAPSYPGGIDAFYKFLSANIRYPKAARDNNVMGRVFIQFIVERDGALTNIRIARGIGSGCDEEAVRVLKTSPSWIPGMQNGRKVRVQYVVPITFTLNNQILGANSTGADTKPLQISPGNMVFTSVEQQPTFPTGIEGFYNYLAKTIRYPAAARNNNIQGKVFVTFVIEKDGAITNVKVARGIGGGCDEEAIRVMNLSPNWVPGVQNGYKVRSQFTIPITFSLVDAGKKTAVKDTLPKKVKLFIIKKDISGNLLYASDLNAAEAGMDTTQHFRKTLLIRKTGTEPTALFVVDGKEMEYADFALAINPDQIQSIHVINGPKAIADYGAKAVSGVVVVDTKKSSK